MNPIILMPNNYYGLEMKGQVIAETTKGLCMYDCVQIEDKKYTISQIHYNPTKYGVREIIELGEDETNYEDNLKCPFCGYEEEDSWELSDDQDETECGRCGARLEYTRHVAVTYSATLKEKPNIVVLD